MHFPLKLAKHWLTGVGWIIFKSVTTVSLLRI